MAKIVYRQMPTPRELSQQLPAPPPPGQKVGCKSRRVSANFLCKSPGVRGGMVMDEIDTCITPVAQIRVNQSQRKKRRYGLHVSVIVIPAVPIMRSPQSPEVYGPDSFGYKGVQYKGL